MESIAVNYEPNQYLAGWKPSTGRLFVPALSDAKLGEHVAVRVGIFGQSIRATVFGKIASVRRIGRPTLPPGVELTLDKASLSAANFLAVAARGEPVSFRERSPRFAVERPLTLVRESNGQELVVKTVNIAEGGCAVEWSGPPPAVGELLGVKVRVAIFTTSVRVVVCWATPAVVMPVTVGLRVVARGLPARAWRALVAEVAKAGARSS